MVSKEDETDIKNENENEFRSPQSDIEIPTTARKRRSTLDNESVDSLGVKMDSSNVTKENMSTNRRPTDSDFTQQRLFGWQPILTPYNVLPVLFILGLLFIPIGGVLYSASYNIKEFSIDYTDLYKDGLKEMTYEFTINNPIPGPVAVYYRLTNFYQNNRLYAMSKSDEQLKGKPIIDLESLKDCYPLDGDSFGKPYYPCGLIANSYFTDEFSLKATDGTSYKIDSNNIAWPDDFKLYGPSQYLIDQVIPPPAWQDAKIMGIVDGKYTTIPNLDKNERFQNWMKISGLPTFRKLYGRINVATLEAGTYILTVKGNYNVKGYQGTKSFIISSTNWAGGQNYALAIGFFVIGSVLIILGLIFLVMFMMAPRKVGDVSYLSWYAENSGDPLTEIDETIETQNN